MSSTRISPITNKPAPFTHTLNQRDGWYGWWSHEADGFADFCATDDVIDNIDHYPRADGSPRDGEESTFYTAEEKRAALDLIRSYLWRVRILDTKALVVSDRRFYDAYFDKLVSRGKMSGHLLRTFDSFVAEAKELTFVEKAMQTLRNMLAVWRRTQQSYVPQFMVKLVDGTSEFRYLPDVPVMGLAYGCGAEDVPLIFEYLNDEGLLVERGSGYRVSGKGLSELDRFERGGNPRVRRAFVVRSWSNDLDLVLKPILARVGVDLSCTIKAIWEEEHNERIDERIFRLIRESSVIVADISHVKEKPDRFNVGLEVGYAYALGKPIVLVRELPPQGAEVPRWVKELPFDVSTLNCHSYTRTPEGIKELEEKIKARVGLALDELALK